MARLNLIVDDDVPTLLTELAGSERKLGAYVSKLVHSVAAGEKDAQSGNDLEMLRLALAGMAGKQKEFDGRLLQVERQLSAMIADRS
jgi:hypothetical protein